MKKIEKIIFFTSSPIPTNEKFFNDIIKDLELEKVNEVEDNIEEELSEKANIKIQFRIDPVNFLAEDEIYYIRIQLGRLEFGMKNSINDSDYNLLDFENKYNKIIEKIESAYLEIARVGYVHSFFEKDKGIESLNINFLNNKDKVEIRFNKEEEIENYIFNNHVRITDTLDDEKGLLILQDFNSKLEMEKTFNKDFINKVFKKLKEEYYEINFKEKILNLDN